MKRCLLKYMILCCLSVCFGGLFSQTSQSTDSLTMEETTAQPPQKTKDHRIFVGGSLGGHISNNSLYFQLSPRVGYSVVQWKNFQLVPGVSFTYQYHRHTTGVFQLDNNYPATNIYGPGVFARFYYKNFFVHTEYQHLYYQWNKSLTQDDFLLLGAGISFPVGRKYALNFSLLFDVLKHEEKHRINDNPQLNIEFLFK